MTLFVDDEFTDFYTEAYINQEYPEHSRTSCSDSDTSNADVKGHGCWRCNALHFRRAERNANKLAAILHLVTIAKGETLARRLNEIIKDPE